MIVHVQNSDDVDEEYDTDNEIGPFFDQVMNEGELTIQERPLNSTQLEITALAHQHAMNPTLPPSNYPTTFVSFMNTAPQPILPPPPLAGVQPSGTPQTSIRLSVDDFSDLKVAGDMFHGGYRWTIIDQDGDVI